MIEQRLRELLRDATEGLEADADLAARVWGTRREQRRWPWLAAAASVACAATIVVLLVILDGHDGAPEAAGPSGSVTVDHKDKRTESTPRVTARDRRTARQFVAFARKPGRARGVRFAPSGVGIGMGDELVKTVRAGHVGSAKAWTIRRAFWKGWSGPFSALSTLRRNARTPLNTIVERRGRCAARSVPPAPLDGLRRIAVEPRPVRSCIEWFEVALYVDKQYRIHAVTLDLWEP